jgi:hypothetical protein
LKQYNFEVAFCLSLGISVEDNDWGYTWGFYVNWICLYVCVVGFYYVAGILYK